MPPIAIFWHRRDLRLQDNAGLYHALKGEIPVLPLFIFDKDILDKLEDKKDRRVIFIYQQVKRLSDELRSLGIGLPQSSILVKYGKVEEVWKEILQEYNVRAVYTNHDYEPYAQKRDTKIKNLLADNIAFHTYKDQVILEKDEVMKDDGKPYTIYTPYSRKWQKTLTDFHLQPYATEKYFHHFLKTPILPIPSLEEMGFQNERFLFSTTDIKDTLLKNYGENRDFPAIQGTSRISVHLRFGTVSIRALAKKGQILSEKWLNELIWRDFYMMILWHFPHVAQSAFHPAYDRIAWRNNENEFEHLTKLVSCTIECA